MFELLTIFSNEEKGKASLRYYRLLTGLTPFLLWLLQIYSFNKKFYLRFGFDSKMFQPNDEPQQSKGGSGILQ